jgi:hypothetical protein
MARSAWHSRIPEIVDKSQLRAATGTRASADRIVEGAKRRSRVRTGWMRDHWTAERVDQYEWEVGNPVEYTVYNEFGTRYMSAQPMLGPATLEEFAHQQLARDLQEAYS